jgi:hypothetical protein
MTQIRFNVVPSLQVGLVYAEVSYPGTVCAPAAPARAAAFKLPTRTVTVTVRVPGRYGHWQWPQRTRDPAAAGRPLPLASVIHGDYK